jgi:hypothetical protein
MKRLALLIASFAVIALPATAAAASSRGVVLTVSSSHHRLTLVDRRDVVHSYRYRRSTPQLQLGTRVRFTYSGSVIDKLSSAGARAHVVSFLGLVTRASSASLKLRLGDGQSVTVGARNAAKSFTPATVVLVSEKIGRGAPSISVKPAAASSPGVGGEHQLSGVVSSVASSSVAVSTSQETVSLQISAGALARDGLAPCDKVVVKYHQHGAHLIADKVVTDGTSASGTCARDSSGAGGPAGSGDNGAGDNGSGDDGSGDNGSGDDGSGDGSQDVIGTITTVSPSGLTVSVPGTGSMTFIVDTPDITDGYVDGDQVDVTYDQDSNGTLDASDVEYNENDALGTVDQVSSSSLTITDSSTGGRDTFTADPSDGTFDGISQGDDVVDNVSEAGDGS